jgi:hypothetical protein
MHVAKTVLRHRDSHAATAYLPGFNPLGALMSTIHAASFLPGRSLERPWSLWSWSLYVLVPVLMLDITLAAKYADGDTEYWVLQSEVGVRESLTGILAF